MTNPKIKELLAVLDLPEFEQQDWVFKNVAHEHPDSIPRYERKMRIADLAFRLRDEGGNFNEGLTCVFEHLEGFSAYKEMLYWVCGLGGACQPIHWIIAALIAKELEKK